MGYKRYGNSGSVPTFNDDNNGEAVSNGILKNSSNKEIYFGIKKPKSAADSDKPWRELTTDDFDTQITSETDGCSATITKNNNDPTNKTGIIRYTLSKNTTGSSRLITFKYNGTTLFTITQDAGATDNNTYVYLRQWNGYEYQFPPTTSYRIAAKGDLQEYKFSDTLELEEQKIEIKTWGPDSTRENILYHVTNNKDISDIFTYNIKINELVKLGILTYADGKKFDSNTLNVIKAPVNMCKAEWKFEEVKDNTVMYIYKCRSENDGLLHATKMTDEEYNKIDWGNINKNEDVTSIGKYIYTPKKKVKIGTIYIIAFKGSNYSSYNIYIFNTDLGPSFTSSINYKSFSFNALQNGRFVFYYSKEDNIVIDNIVIENKMVSELLNNGTLVYNSGKTNLSKLVDTNAVYNPTLYTNAKAPKIINVYNSTAPIQLTFNTKLYGYSKVEGSNTYNKMGLNGIAFSDITNNEHFGAYDYYVYQ